MEQHKGLAEDDEKEGAVASQCHAMLEGMSHFVGLLSPAGQVLSINRAALELIGLERRATVGKLLWELPVWAPERQSRLQADLAQVVAHKAALCYELEVLPNLQGPSYLDFCLRPQLDSTGAVVSIVVEGYDVTERKRLEAELRETQHWLQDTQAVARLAPGSWRLPRTKCAGRLRPSGFWALIPLRGHRATLAICAATIPTTDQA